MPASKTAALLIGSALLQSSSAFVPQMGGSARAYTELFARKPFMYVTGRARQSSPVHLALLSRF